MTSMIPPAPQSNSYTQSFLQNHLAFSLKSKQSQSITPHVVRVTTSNNGKFNLSEAVKNFIKGLLSPVSFLVNMFKGVGKFVTGAAIIGIGIGAIAFGGAPVVIGAAIALGVLFTALGGFQLTLGKNGDTREKSLKNFGKAIISFVPLLLVHNKGRQGQPVVMAKGFSDQKTLPVHHANHYTNDKHGLISYHSQGKTGINTNHSAAGSGNHSKSNSKA